LISGGLGDTRLFHIKSMHPRREQSHDDTDHNPDLGGKTLHPHRLVPLISLASIAFRKRIRAIILPETVSFPSSVTPLLPTPQTLRGG